jgi:hypothetical protein
MPNLFKWQEDKAERNRQSFGRLTKALPRIFPPVVLSRALNRPFVPPTPRLAIDGYWGAHPIRADRLARALAARSGAPSGWTWRLADKPKNGLPATFRTPPAPYRKLTYARGPGFCCVCGQPVYRFGWHVDLWDAGANKNANWHCAAWSPGDSGMRQAVRPASYGACKRDAAAKPAAGFGRPPRLTTASRFFGCGENTGTRRGRRCSIIGGSQTSKSLIAKSTPKNARPRRGTGTPRALSHQNVPEGIADSVRRE